METKPTTSLRDRKISPSLISSPVEAKKPLVNYLKPSTKTPSARRLADKAPSPSTFKLQRSLKPATSTPKPSSSSMPNGHKAAQTVSRTAITARTSLVPKAKSTSLTFVKKKEASVTIAVIPDHDAVTAIERPVEALNEVENVEESDFISSLVDEGNHIEEQKSDEPENWGEVLVPPQVFDEVDEDLEVKRPIQGAMVVMEMAAVKKKDASISNDVIEETKSKLMGTRKNKVLALVGAFETVISLQEPEGQQIQKTLQLQHGQQIQHDQQVEIKRFKRLRV